MTARVGHWVLAAALVAGGLVGCSEQRPQPDVAAGELAAGLASLDLASAPVRDAERAAQALTEATQDLGGLSPDVRVQEVRRDEQDEDRASAVLAYTWDVDHSGSDWTYTTSAPLTYSEERGWQAQWSPSMLEPSLTEGERLQVRRTAAERGEILGAGGAVLVTDRPVLRLGIDKTLVQPDQAAASAVSLAELVGVEPQAFSERVAASGPRAFVQALVVRADGSSPVNDASLAAIPGAVALPDELPLAPTREFARPLLGSVGEATAELVEQSGGRLRPGDVTGLSGLQLIQDERLSGRPGIVVQAIAAEPPAGGTAAQPRELFTLDPVPGEAVATTLDPDLQTLAENVLAPVQPASAVVVLQPSTGDVLAAASGPGGQGYSTATLGRYPPGSTFKVVSTLGLLRAGLTGASQVPCPPSVTVDGRSFTNYGDYPAAALGDIPLRTAVAQSCNTAFIASRDLVPQPDLASAAADLGLGGQYDLGVPSFAGSVPAQAGATEHAASMLGQGRVEASPLAIATVAASVAAGRTVRPRLLQDSRPAAGEALEEAPQLQQLLRAVVSEGSAAFLADVPGSPVGAKTGTAEYGSEQPPRTHAWMLAIQGDLAVVVFVEDGESGASTAGPILEQMLTGT